jgi:hypothetical protein
MNQYKVIIDVTSQWEIEISAEDETEAIELAEEMGLEDIEAAGSFQAVISVEASDVERVYGEDDDESI